MVHGHAVVRQQVANTAEIGRQVGLAHVLEHADAGNAVELAGGVAVVLEADLDAVRQPGSFYALRGEVELVLRKRDAHAARAELLRGAQHQRAPAAADIEERLPRLEPDPGQDVVDLLQLRGSKVFIALLEVRARVDHVRVEPELVEVVRDVVVILDRRLVFLLGMGEVLGHAGEGAAGTARGRGGEAVSNVDDVCQAAFEVDLLLDIRLAEVVQARYEQQRQGGGLAYRQGDVGLLEMAERVLVAIPEPELHRQVGVLAHVGDPAIELLVQGLFEKHAASSRIGCGTPLV